MLDAILARNFRSEAFRCLTNKSAMATQAWIGISVPSRKGRSQRPCARLRVRIAAATVIVGRDPGFRAVVLQADNCPMACAATQTITGSSSRRPLWKIFVLCTAVTLSLAPTLAADRQGAGSFEIEVDSKTGFFTSPGYTLKIAGSGGITYRGYANVHAIGKRHGRISRAAVERLVADIRSSGFLDLPGPLRRWAMFGHR
jgi:Domain of unknown function (DUF6438)